MNDAQILVEALRDAGEADTTITAEDVLNEMQKIAEDFRKEGDRFSVEGLTDNEAFGKWVALTYARQKIEDKISELKAKGEL